MPRCTPIISNSGGHLAVLVGKAIQKDGLNCDLNHIDVSRVEDFKGVFRKWPKFQGDISKWVIKGINADAMFEVVSQERVVASDGKHLQALIRQAMHINGDAAALDHIDISGMTDLSDVFAGVPTFNGDISRWDVSHVTSMKSMFKGSVFDGDIGGWDVSNVMNMEGMFEKSKFNGDLSKWDVSNATTMENMFRDSRFNGDISRWDVSHVTSMKSMFKGSVFDGDIGGWAVSNVMNMEGMFGKSKFNGDLSKWNVSNVRNMQYLFEDSAFNNDISKWDTSAVLTMQGLFMHSSFNQPIGDWDVGRVQLFALIFCGSSFSHPLNNWNTASARDMAGMFRETTFNQDISGWDVSRVTRATNMFGASAFSQDISQWTFSPKLEDKDLAAISGDNPHFLAAQSMSPWIVRLHLLNRVTPTDLAWEQAFTLSAPVAEGLGLSLHDHVQAIVAMHARIVGEALGPGDLETPVDAALFV